MRCNAATSGSYFEASAIRSALTIRLTPRYFSGGGGQRVAPRQDAPGGATGPEGSGHHVQPAKCMSGISYSGSSSESDPGGVAAKANGVLRSTKSMRYQPFAALDRRRIATGMASTTCNLSL
jgi:hypothetical protein